MTKTVVYQVRVEFGDCDPARIVWFPNFFRWIDASSRHFFVSCGVPSWQVTEATMGILGTPLVDTQASFRKTASYGDELQIHTSVTEWREKVLIHKHVVKRGDTVLCEGTETRAWCARDPDNHERIKAVRIPDEIRALCS